MEADFLLKSITSCCERFRPGGLPVLRSTGMCRPNGLVFYKSSLDMGHIHSPRPVGPSFTNITEKK